jgi:hypothetical protein
VPRAAELGLRPSLPVPLPERDGQDAPIGNSLSRPLPDVDELLSGHVQQHCVGQHRVVRSAEVIHPDVQQPRLMTSGFEHLDKRRGAVSAQNPRASALEVHRVPSGTAAEFEHGAVADQPGYLVQIRQDGWPGWRRVHQVEVRGRVVGAERDVPGLARGRRTGGHRRTVCQAAARCPFGDGGAGSITGRSGRLSRRGFDP